MYFFILYENSDNKHINVQSNKEKLEFSIKNSPRVKVIKVVEL